MSKIDERQNPVRAGEQGSKPGGVTAPAPRPQQQSHATAPRPSDDRDATRKLDTMMEDHSDHPISRPAISTED